MKHPHQEIRLFLVSFHLILMIELLFSNILTAEEKRLFDTRYNVSFEYDDNVFDTVRTKRVSNQAAVFSVNSNINLLNGTDMVALINYQGGVKKYVNITTNEEPSAGSVGINRVDVVLEKKLNSRFYPGFNGRIKSKNVFNRDAEFEAIVVPTEIGYLYGYGELYMRVKLDGDLSGIVSFKHSFSNFEDFDNFNIVANELGFKVKKPIIKNLSGGAGYNVRVAEFNRQANDLGEDFLVDEMFVTLDSEQRDLLQQFDLNLQFYQNFLLNLIYTFQNNDSNSYGLSYTNNRITLLFGKKVTEDMFLHFYTVFQIKEYSDPSSLPILLQLQTEENQNNAFITKISKTFLNGLDAELKYSWYRNESTERDLSYTKNVYSLAIHYSY